MKPFTICVATEEHLPYAPDVVEALAAAARASGTGLAKRSIPYIEDKIREGRRLSPCTAACSPASATSKAGNTSAMSPPPA